jgi:mannose-6-phosphate isomerase-like protein (cupin superfamily)
MPITEQQKYAANARKGRNFTSYDAGSMDDLFQYDFHHPKVARKVRGKLFLKEILGLSAMQISLNKLPAGVAVPFLHRHKQNEEVYLFIKGQGQMQIDNESIDVKEGTVIRVSPDGNRTWRNNSSEDLYYVVIQAKEGSLEQETFEDGVASDESPCWD